MSACSYGECPSDCGESDCNCPCHQDALEDAKSESGDDCNSEKFEGLCSYYECREDCYGYSDDCNCPCHQDDLEAWCSAECEAEPCAALERYSTEERNSAKVTSDDESK